MEINEILNFDKRLQVDILASTDCPQKLCWANMHQCYSEGSASDTLLNEEAAGEAVVKRALKHGHFSVLEAPTITFNVLGFPHSVMQQARTHRIGVNFQVQSMRYTGKRLCESLTEDQVEDFIYLRPPGQYKSRQGDSYFYSEETHRKEDRTLALLLIKRYADRCNSGFSEEHMRGLLPFDFRQNWCVTFNIRSLMHFLDMRSPKDAQLEIRVLSYLLMDKFSQWAPDIASFYRVNRFGKSRLAP